MIQATRFAAAVERADVKIAKRLLAAGCDVNTRCPDPKDLQTSWCALLRAAYLGHVQIVQVLLAAGARNDARLSHDQVTQSDSQFGNDPNVELAAATALYVAAARHCEHGNGLGLVRALLRYEADPNACNALASTPLMAVMEHGGGNIVVPGQTHLKNIDEQEMDTTNVVIELLQGGADPTRHDRNGWTALLLGCYLGRLEEVRLLLEYTTPNCTVQKESVWRSGQETAEGEVEGEADALKRAPRSKSGSNGSNGSNGSGTRSTEPSNPSTVPPQMVSTLVEERDENGRTALMLACQEQKPDIVRVLIKHGANVDAERCANNCWTSLMYCLKNGSDECVAILIQNGVSLGNKKYASSLSWTLTSSEQHHAKRKQIHERVAHQRREDTTNNKKGSSAAVSVERGAPETASMPTVAAAAAATGGAGAVALKKDTLLFPRDEHTGWTPFMIGAHHCISIQHATTLRLVLEACGPVNPEIFDVDPIAFPNETRSAIDLATVRGNTAALRLFAEARKRWKNFTEFLTGRAPLPTLNDNLLKLQAKQHHLKHNAQEISDEKKANRDKQRRREERFNRKRDIEEEHLLKMKREGKRNGNTRLMPIVGKKNRQEGSRSGNDGAATATATAAAAAIQRSHDLESQLEEALKEVARLRVVLSDTRHDRNFWKQSTRERENEIADSRQHWQSERKELLGKCDA